MELNSIKLKNQNLFNNNFLNENLLKINELILQNAIKRFFANDNSEVKFLTKDLIKNFNFSENKNNSKAQNEVTKNKITNTKQFVTKNGKSLTIFSIGEHNFLPGPDFRNACLLIDGNLKVGDIEFHKKNSQWISHGHYKNPEYSNVILHIIFQEDVSIQEKISANFETLILEQNQLKEYLNPKIKYLNYDFDSYGEFSKYAFLRFLRRSSEIHNLLKNNKVNETFQIFTSNYLTRFFSLSKRPIRNFNYSIDEIVEKILKSSFYNSILSFKNTKAKNIPENENINDFFDDFLKSKSLDFGEHLKLELLINVLLPFSFSISKNEIKEKILSYYLTKKSKEKYGILARKFPQIQQKFVWQQQGMLEYLKESGNLNSKNQSKYKNADYLINYDFLKDFSAFFKYLEKPFTR
jgi:hypothetical protein